jgi:hypothetical protein
VTEVIHITRARFYRFEGWTFEWHRNKPFGPWPCKKDLEPRKRAGRRFYAMFTRFHALSEVEQERCRF